MNTNIINIYSFVDKEKLDTVNKPISESHGLPNECYLEGGYTKLERKKLFEDVLVARAFKPLPGFLGLVMKKFKIIAISVILFLILGYFLINNARKIKDFILVALMVDRILINLNTGLTVF
mgnify:CR=1 FL=1